MNPSGTRSRLAGSIALAATLVSLAGAQSGIDVIVNGEPVVFRGVGPQTMNGRVLVPLRGVLEKIGAYVDWNPAGQLVTATRGDIDLELRIGDRVARVNGRPVSLDVPAQILRGSTMVPLRFVSEALGADVRWDAQQYAVIINTPVTDVSPNRPGDADRDIRITSFDVEPEGWLRPGTVVRFRLVGTPGGRAFVSIPGVTREIEMDEIRSGEYTARWTVPDNTGRDDVINVSRANVIARLRVDGRERVIQDRDPISVDNRDPQIRSMRPEPDMVVTTSRPTISASFDDEAGSGIDTRTVRIRLDGDDVTDEATVTESYITYRPTRNLRNGEHEVSISARDRAGNSNTRTWTFRVDDRGERVVRSFEVLGARDAMPGDVVRMVLLAEPRGRATFSIGDEVRDVRMEEVSPGRYEGSYTVRRGDSFDRDTISARFVTRAGVSYTVHPSSDFGVNTGALDVPVITSPRAGDEVNTPLVIEGRANPNARVLVRVDYATEVAGALRLTGAVTETVVVADDNGRFRTQPIDLETLVSGKGTTYTIKARTVRNGQRSEETQVVVRR